MYQRTWTLGLEAREDESSEELEPVITETPEESVEATDLEINAASDDVDAAEQEVNDLTKDIDQLQTVHDIVADSVSDGGCEDSNTRLIEVAVESFTNRWDLPKSALGLESMAYATPTIRARIACESIGEVIKNGIKKLIEFIKSVVAKLKGLFKSTEDLPTKLRGRIAKLEKAAEERKDNEFNRKKWSLGSWTRNISMGGELAPKEIFNRPGKIINTTEFMFGDAVSLANGIVEKINATAKESFTKRMKLAFFGSESMPVQLKRKLGILSDDVRVVSFPGELYLIGERSKIFDDVITKIEGRNLRLDDFKLSYISGEIDHKQTPIDAPTHAEIEKALDAAKEFTNALEKHTNNGSEYEKHLEIMEQGIKILENSMNVATDESEKVDWRTMIIDKQQAMSNFRVLSQMMLISLRNAATGMLSYAEAGLRCYA